MVVICAAPPDLCARGDWGAVRGAAADRGRRQCGLAALLVVDHQEVVDDDARAEPDRRGEHSAVPAVRRADGAGP